MSKIETDFENYVANVERVEAAVKAKIQERLAASIKKYDLCYANENLAKMTGSVAKQLALDHTLFGISIARHREDGTLERVDPTNVSFRYEQTSGGAPKYLGYLVTTMDDARIATMEDLMPNGPMSLPGDGGRLRTSLSIKGFPQLNGHPSYREMTTVDEIAPVPLFANQTDRMFGIQQRSMTKDEEADAKAFFKHTSASITVTPPSAPQEITLSIPCVPDFMAAWLSHMAAERADAAIARYPGKWPPPRHKLPGE